MSDLQGRGTIHGIVRVGVDGGVTDYDDLTNRPSINNHVVTGSKTGHDYELANLEDVIIKELNPTITPGVNYPRINHIMDKNNQIFIVEYPWFSGRIAGLVPQALNPTGKVLNDSGNWVNLPTQDDLASMTWNLLINQAGGTLSNYVSVADAKYIITIMDYQGTAYAPYIFKVSNFDKILSQTSLTEIAQGYNWKVGGSYDDWEIHYNLNKEVAIKATYSQITAKVYTAK